MKDNKIRWGIMGCGDVASRFAKDLEFLPDAKLVAVGSRSKEKGQNFADKFDVEKSYGSYEELASDSSIDAIYVATVHSAHMENVILCLKNKKAVLCEKPFAMNYEQVKKIRESSIEENVFLMEAMRPRFLPVISAVKKMIKTGKIGEILSLHADFGFSSNMNGRGRLFDPDLGGGALLDVGIYSISLASMIFEKQPDNIKSIAHIGSTGVDEQSLYLFRYSDGAIASLSSSIVSETRCSAFISGTKGTILIASPFWRARRAIITINNNKDVINLPFDGDGFWLMVEEVHKCLRENKTQSDIFCLDESVAIMKTVDKINKEMRLI